VETDPAAIANELFARYGASSDASTNSSITKVISDIAIASAPLKGADLWNEARIRSKILMSDPLVTAIREAEVRIDFHLSECRIVEPGQW
jgi:hypothetical protein